MKHFKELTTGHTVIMGRKTFDSLKKPLPQRHNVVVTRDKDYRPAGASVAHSFSEALHLAEGEDEVFVAGGGEIYQQAMQLADRLYVTVVHAVFEGDTVFPEIDDSEWELSDEARHEPDARHSVAFSFKTYQRAEERPM